MAYVNSDHNFVRPIRKFKANDPYYYEVDNIPITQLEENVLWLKDQFDSFIEPASGDPVEGQPLFVGDDLDLEHIKQFRPKHRGGRSIEIQAGRFNARVNDAYQVYDGLSQLTATFLSGCSKLPQITETQTTAFFDAVWDSFTKQLTDDNFVGCDNLSNIALAYRMNGLETMYTFHISNFGQAVPTSETTTYGAPEYSEDGSGRNKVWPGMWHRDIKNLNLNSSDWRDLSRVHMDIVQHWRGVTRTAVCDFRGETIEIEPFNEFDYFYVEEVGGVENTVSLQNLATQRIDLIVVYTQAIDSSGTTIGTYDPGVSPVALPGGVGPQTPNSFTTPKLGVIKGAGVGIKRTEDDRIELIDTSIYPGEQKILGNINDHLDGRSNTGIRLKNGAIINGSFPSPDDLANIAPNLTLDLDDNDLQLVGQTALPIAYVVVTKDNSALVQEDIIDIRPFLRTTELAYNERAGIAAAQPPLSFANPAIGAAHLNKVVECLEAKIDATATTTPTTTTTSNNVKFVYHDAVMGGLVLGVEGSLLLMNETTGGPWDDFGGRTSFLNKSATDRRTDLKTLYEGQGALGGSYSLSRWMTDPNNAAGERGRYLGLNDNRIIPLYPEWEPQVNDDTPSPANNFNGRPLAWTWKSNDVAAGNYSSPGIDGDATTFTAGSNLSLLYLKKTVRLKLGAGVDNIDVNANFAGCSPVTGNNPYFDYNIGSAGISGGISLGQQGSLQPVDTQISIFKTGVFVDSNGESVVDVTFVIPCPQYNVVNDSDGDDDSLRYLVMSPESLSPTAQSYPFGGTQGNQTAFQGIIHPDNPKPKIGLANYPTITYSIIGYGESVNNTTVLASGNGGSISDVTGFTGEPPWSATPTTIDLTGI